MNYITGALVRMCHLTTVHQQPLCYFLQYLCLHTTHWPVIFTKTVCAFPSEIKQNDPAGRITEWNTIDFATPTVVVEH
jgi:hypothetical protein